MTKVGSDGKTERPRSKRSSPTTPQPGQSAPTSTPDCQTQTTSQSASNSTSEVESAPLHADVVIPDSPLHADAAVPDCPLLVRNECPHGQSGKRNGQCQYRHRPRCSKYMKWGDKAANGCKKVPCDKLHPLLCPRSLDLKCLEKSCDVKLHTSKCRRLRPAQPDSRVSADRGPVHTQPPLRVPQPQHVSRGTHHSVGPHVHDQWQQPHVGLQVPLGAAPSYQYQPPPPPKWGLGLSPDQSGQPWGGLTQGAAGSWPAWWQSSAACQPAHSSPSTQTQPTVTQPTVISRQNLQATGVSSVENLPTVSPQANGPPVGAQPLPPSFQLGCAVTSPTVHQILEVWATNMARELARQSDITRGLLVSSVKEMSQHLGSQGGLRPSC